MIRMMDCYTIGASDAAAGAQRIQQTRHPARLPPAHNGQDAPPPLALYKAQDPRHSLCPCPTALYSARRDETQQGHGRTADGAPSTGLTENIMRGAGGG